jgi:Cytochrome c
VARGRRCLAALVVVASVACRGSAPELSSSPLAAEPAPHEAALAGLRAFEAQRRAATDFATLPPSDVALGPDPYRIAALGDRWIGLLRGASAVVLLDHEGAELARVAAPRSPSGLAVARDGGIFVVGEAARELVQYRADAGPLRRVATVPIDALGMRAVALAPDARTAYVVEDREGRLLAVTLAPDPADRAAVRATGVRELARCHGPIQVEALDGDVAVNCLLDHTIELRRPDREVARIHHDGPLWGFALHREADGGVLVAAGGVEDHPLEREDGGFGYIDSFVYLYRLAPGAPQPHRLAAINTSALGVVTPKWIALRTADAAVSVTTAGYGSAGLLTLTWAGDLAAPPQVTPAELPPGTSAAQLGDDGTLIAANPLLDAWVVRRAGAPRVVPVAGARARAVTSRIGELLFFTTMMSPWNSADGKRSRFTCETCHHEGYVDGRTHYTGRDRVFATTRPLVGLFNNRPHFSRALDKTMTQMVDAEFRVANRHNGRDPWFALTRADVPWLDQIEGAPARLSPELLREALMTFLMDFTHRANPAAIDHARFTPRERSGARAFRDHCASCHAARLVADDPGSQVPFERWEALVLSPSGPIVWSDAAYEQTGVVPYVHASGARVPALRRLDKKWPYFTSGGARSLAALLDRFAASPGATYHDGAPAGATRLSPEDQAAILAFLALL